MKFNLQGQKRHYGFNHGENNQMVATTILCVRKDSKVVMIGDGQVTFGTTRLKGNARKVRRVYNDTILGKDYYDIEMQPS